MKSNRRAEEKDNETSTERQREETEQRKSLDLIARFARDMHPHLGPRLGALVNKKRKEQ